MEDKCIRFRKLPKEYTEHKINSGENGCCYRLNDDLVYKWLFEPYEDYSELKKHVKLSVPGFVFPKYLVFLKNRFDGYLMEYVDGVNFKNRISMLMRDYINETIRFEYNIAVLSRLNIFAIDLSRSNFMITKDGHFKAIDTDLYRVVESNNNLYSHNLALFSHVILSQFFDLGEIISGNIGFDNKKFNLMCRQIHEGKCLPSKLLNELYAFYSTDISTGEVRDSMKLLLK